MYLEPVESADQSSVFVLSERSEMQRETDVNSPSQEAAEKTAGPRSFKQIISTIARPFTQTV